MFPVTCSTPGMFSVKEECVIGVAFNIRKATFMLPLTKPLALSWPSTWNASSTWHSLRSRTQTIGETSWSKHALIFSSKSNKRLQFCKVVQSLDKVWIYEKYLTYDLGVCKPRQVMGQQLSVTWRWRRGSTSYHPIPLARTHAFSAQSAADGEKQYVCFSVLGVAGLSPGRTCYPNNGQRLS